MASEVRPGVVLDGKYEILNLLGAGGMGEVFKARHVHLNAFRCIKVMKQGLLADDSYRTRFLREAQLATQIHHPNIAVVHDFFLAERGSYMVTEFIDGTTVRQWSKAFGFFPLPLAADVVVQVLAGLDHIHRRGLLHRDISADNIMLSYERDDSLLAKIIDLGIAKDVNVVSNETMAGMLVGNPKYMSPEQLGDLAAGEQVDHRADLYCLGVVIYEMLLGVPPFISETPHGYIVKHLTHAPRPFAAVTPGVEWPAGLEAVIFRALEKDRRNRYADAREFSAAMQPFLSAPPGSLTKTAVERLQRMPDKTLVEKLPDALTEVTPAEPAETETERDWKKTVAQDSVSGYRQYIERHPHAPDTTEAKARVFELSLLEDVREREKESDRDALQRLAEGHPPGSLVGNAARDALVRLRNAQEEAKAEEDDFQRAWEIGTSAGWRAFIDKYAASPRAVRAQEFLDEALGFEEAAAVESHTGVRQFLKVWPDGRHHLEAEIRLVALKQRLADAAFAETAALDTAASWRDFLSRFPASLQSEQAQRALAERLAFATAASNDSQKAWASYLAAWGTERHAAEARARLAAIEETVFASVIASKDPKSGAAFLADFPDSSHREDVARLVSEWNAEARRESEPRDWDGAWEAGTVAAWDRYLADHPDSERGAGARLCRQEAVDFELAVTTASASMWRAFVKAWPEGRHRLDAEVRLRGWK